VSAQDANMATSLRRPGRLGAVPAARGGNDPAYPWLRIDGRGVSGLPPRLATPAAAALRHR